MEMLYYIKLIIILLHISAGVGRTGTFIAIDAMMQRLKNVDNLNINEFVIKMRTRRTFMVQNQVHTYICAQHVLHNICTYNMYIYTYIWTSDKIHTNNIQLITYVLLISYIHFLSYSRINLLVAYF